MIYLILFLLASPEQLNIHIQQRTALQHKIEALKQDLKRNLAQKSALDQQLENITKSMAHLILEQQQIKKQIEQLNRQMIELKEQKKDQQIQADRLKKQLALLIRSAYISGQNQAFKWLLTENDPNRISRLSTYYQYFSQTQIKYLKLIQQKKARLQAISQALKQKKYRLYQLSQEQKMRLDSLIEQKKQKQQITQLLQKKLHEQKKQLQRWQADQKQLDRLIQAIEQALQQLELPDKPPFDQQKGRLYWPVQFDRILANFGQKKAKNLNWKGLLLSVPEQTDVRAVYSGRVVYADWLRGYGLLMIIDHGNGYMSLYGQNQALFKEVGYWVDTGERIAQTTHRFYFAIRHRGQALNPILWLERESQ